MPNSEPLTIAEAADSIGVPKASLRHMLMHPDRRSRLLHAYRTGKKGLRTVEMVPPELIEELRAAYGRPAPSPPAGPAQPTAVQAPSRNGAPAEPLLSAGPFEFATPPRSEPADGAAGPRSAGAAPASTQDPAHAADSTEPDPGASSPGGDSGRQLVVEAVAESQMRVSPAAGSGGDAIMIVAAYERLLAEREARLMDIHSALECERENTRRLAEALAASQEALRAAQAPQPAPGTEPKGFWARLRAR